MKKTNTKREQIKTKSTVQQVFWLKKIFSSNIAWTVIGMVIAAIVAIILYRCERNERLAEERHLHHEDLKLFLECIPLDEKREYSIDVISPDDTFLPFPINIAKDGKYSAKDVVVSFIGDLRLVSFDFIEEYPMIVAQSSLYPYNNERAGDIRFESLPPKIFLGMPILYEILNLKTGDNFSCHITLVAENKTNPIDVKLNMTLFRFTSIDEYREYLSSKYDTPEYLDYFKDKDIIVLGVTDGMDRAFKVAVEGTEVKMWECIDI